MDRTLSGWNRHMVGMMDQESPDIEYPGRFITGGLLEARADSDAMVYDDASWHACREVWTGPTWGRNAMESR